MHNRIICTPTHIFDNPFEDLAHEVTYLIVRQMNNAKDIAYFAQTNKNSYTIVEDMHFNFEISTCDSSTRQEKIEKYRCTFAHIAKHLDRLDRLKENKEPLRNEIKERKANLRNWKVGLTAGPPIATTMTGAGATMGLGCSAAYIAGLTAASAIGGLTASWLARCFYQNFKGDRTERQIKNLQNQLSQLDGLFKSKVRLIPDEEATTLSQLNTPPTTGESNLLAIDSQHLLRLV